MKAWKRKYKNKYARVLSRHPSHSFLRLNVRVKQPTLIRLGSVTVKSHDGIEINTIAAINNCTDKIRMKQLFKEAGVQSPEFWLIDDNLPDDLPFPVVAKRQYRSRGAGMRKINNAEELEAFLNERVRGNEYNKQNNYYLERYVNYSREYRIHVSKLGGYFYTCRKMLKEGTNDRWYRNDSNSVWFVEDNPEFNKPDNWNDIVADCQRALNATGMDIAGMDVIVAKDGRWKIIEINSACSFGELTKVAYKDELEKLAIEYAS